MSHRPSNVSRWLTLAVVGGGLVLAAQLQAAGPGAPPPGKSIKFSSSDQGTNFNQINNSRRDGMKQLEEELNKSLLPFSRDSLSGSAVPPARPIPRVVLPDKRTQEMMERRKNWALLSPDEVLMGPTVDGLLDQPAFDKNGQPKKKLSPVEEFLYPEKADAKVDGKNSAHSDRDSKEDSDERENADLPESVKQSQRKLQEDLRAFSPAAQPTAPEGRGNLSDIFGLNPKGSLESDLAEKARLEEWKGRWSLPKPTGGQGGQLGSVFDPARSAPAAMTPAPNLLPDVSSFKRDLGMSGTPSLGILQPSLLDASARSYNGYNAMSSPLNLPKPEPPKLTPPLPTFSAPRRTFN